MNLTLSNPNLQLRDILPDDEEFLFELYCHSRTDLHLLQRLHEHQKTILLRQQFLAQTDHLMNNYKGAVFWIIEMQGVAIGRLYLQEREDTIFGVDIAFLPAYRSSGLGTQVIRDVCNHAASIGKSFSFHVENLNPALRLYTRLGFQSKGTDGIYSLMEWKPDVDSTAS